MDRMLRKLGLGKGRLDLELKNPTCPLGGCLEGTVSYQLKEPCVGKELWVEVRATQRVTAPREVTRLLRRGENRRKIKNQSSTLVLYNFREELDGYHLYDGGSLQFRIPLPCVLGSPYPENETSVDKWLRWRRWGKLVRYDRIRWQVRAKLVIPWSWGVSDSKRFYVKPVSAAAKRAKKNYCGGCGNRREPADEYCPHCGREYDVSKVT